jgi:hypothetical protein
VFKRLAIGDARELAGLLVGRPEQRTYVVVMDGMVKVLGGQSIADAQKKVRGYVGKLVQKKHAPPQQGQLLIMGVG